MSFSRHTPILRSLNVSGFDFKVDNKFRASINVFSFWGVRGVELTPLPAFMVADVSRFAWYDWRSTDGIGTVSAVLFCFVFFKSTLLRQCSSPSTATYDLESNLCCTIAFFHSFCLFTWGLTCTTSPESKGWMDFTLRLKFHSCFLQLSYSIFFKYWDISGFSRSSLVVRSVFVLLDISFCAGDNRTLAGIFLWSSIARYGSCLSSIAFRKRLFEILTADSTFLFPYCCKVWQVYV